MAKSKENKHEIFPSADDLFNHAGRKRPEESGACKNISVYEISDFPNHPFKVKMDDKWWRPLKYSRTWCIGSCSCQREANRWV